MHKTIKLGCIGTGPRGHDLIRAALLHPAAQVTALCDPDAENLAAARAILAHDAQVGLYSSADEMLKADIDAVIVATPISKHALMAAKALEAGKHVLSEIPTIGSLDDARLLFSATRAHPELNYMAGENCCYWEFIRRWKDMYEAGEIGQALFCESDYIHPWHEMERPDGRMTWRSYMPSIHYVTHNLGPLMFITDDEPVEVTGFTPDINPMAERHPAPTDGVAMIRTKKGAMVKIYIGFGNVHRGGHNFIIYGSKGSLENSRLGTMDERRTHAYLSSDPEPYKGREIAIALAAEGTSDFGHGGADARMMAEFINSLLESRKPELDVEYGIKISLPGLLADASSRDGSRPIKMPAINDIISGKA